ncbi:MAG: alpha/beta fold hydrolase [Lawsonella sp.]
MVKRNPARLLVAAATGVCLLFSSLPAAHAADVNTVPNAAPGSFDNNFNGFYDIPRSLPNKPGKLIRTQNFKAEAIEFGDNPEQQLPINGTRIMFSTLLSNGKMGYSTAAFMKSNVTWRHNSLRPLVVHGPGTLGQGAQCAATKTIGDIFSSQGELFANLKGAEPFQPIMNYESITADKLLDAGMDVLTVDYTGSSEGIQSYINNIEAGRVMLDAARALKELSLINGETPVTLLGYSQGGSAAALAATLHPTYAPDVNLRVAVVGAPPLDLIEVSKQIDGSSMTGLIGYAINGFADRYPAMEKLLDRILNADGKRILSELKDTCVIGANLRHGFTKTSSWTIDGRPIYKHLESTPGIRKILDEQLAAAYAAPKVPVLFAADPNDDVVAFNQVKAMSERWCAAGADLEFLEIRFGPLMEGVGLHHIVPGFGLIGPGRDFIINNLTGDRQKGCTTAVKEMSIRK